MDRRFYKVAENDLTMSEGKNSGIKRLFSSLKNEEIGVFYYMVLSRRF